MLTLVGLRPPSNPSHTTTYENTDHCECNGLFYFRKHAAFRLRFISAAGRCFIRRSRASFFTVPLGVFLQTFTDFYGLRRNGRSFCLRMHSTVRERNRKHAAFRLRIFYVAAGYFYGLLRTAGRRWTKHPPEAVAEGKTKANRILSVSAWDVGVKYYLKILNFTCIFAFSVID